MSIIFYNFILPALFGAILMHISYRQGRKHEKAANDRALEAFIRGAVAQKQVTQSKVQEEK